MKQVPTRALSYALARNSLYPALLLVLSFAAQNSSAKESASEEECEVDQVLRASPKRRVGVPASGIQPEDVLKIGSEDSARKDGSDDSCHAVVFNADTIYFCVNVPDRDPEPLDRILRGILAEQNLEPNPEAADKETGSVKQ